jgi:hypothetical protein
MPNTPRWRKSMPRIHRLEYDIQTTMRILMKCHTSLFSTFTHRKGIWRYYKGVLDGLLKQWKENFGSEYDFNSPVFVDIFGVKAGNKINFEKFLVEPEESTEYVEASNSD